MDDYVLSALNFVI